MNEMKKFKIVITRCILVFFTSLSVLFLPTPSLSAQTPSNAENRVSPPKILFSDDFSGTTIDTTKWVPTNGWSQNNILTVNGGGIGYTKKSDFRNFTLDVDFQILPHNGYEYAAFILRQAPDNPFVGTYYLVQIGSKTAFATPNAIRISRGIDLATTLPISFDINTGDWHHLKVSLVGYKFNFLIDNQTAGEWTDPSPFNTGEIAMRRSGAIGINAAGIPGDPLSDFVNYDALVVTK